MRVKLNLLERAFLWFGWMLGNISFSIGQTIHKKYDSEGIYNTHTYNGKKLREMVFSNEEES